MNDKEKIEQKLSKTEWEDCWAVADYIISETYPGWEHVTNKGILREKIASKLIKERQDKIELLKGIKAFLKSPWTEIQPCQFCKRHNPSGRDGISCTDCIYPLINKHSQDK